MKNKILKELNTKGYLVIKNFIPRSVIKKNIYELNLIGKRFQKNFNINNYKHVQKINKKKYHKVISRNNYLFKLALNEKIINLAKKLGCEIPIIGPSYCRVDISVETKHQFNWHQDYPNLLGSLKMFTYWIPLTKVSDKTGSLEIIERSHKLGIFECFPKDNKDKFSSSNMVISDKKFFNKKLKRKILNLNPGDVVVLDPLLVHRSHYNPNSKKVRITNIIRMDNAGDKKHLSLGFSRLDLDMKNINYFKKYKSLLQKRVF